MNLSGNTILITGGTSGIGFELARRLLSLGNTVIVTGRDAGKLAEACHELPGLHGFQSDVSDPNAVALLFDSVTKAFPALNVLINNAGIMRRIDLRQPNDDITREIETDLAGPVRMVSQFLPQLLAQKTAAIVNVSSGLAFVPLPIAPMYCAAKAGVHSFTQSLRVQLANTNVKVFELAPPITQTGLLTRDLHIENLKFVRPLDLGKMVSAALEGLRKDHVDIRPGPAKILALMSRLAPRFALNRLSTL